MRNKIDRALERAASYKSSLRKGDTLNDTELDLIILADALKASCRPNRQHYHSKIELETKCLLGHCPGF